MKKHDIRIDRSKLHPLLDYRMERLLKKCKKKGIYLIITEGFRSAEYQDKLYAKGRTAPGNVVTNARGSSYSSQHQWGIAFDIAINDKDKLYDTAIICKVARIAKKLGLGWGGDWTGIVDKPHFYLKKWGSDTVELKLQYGSFERFRKTWSGRVNYKTRIRMWSNVSRSKVVEKIPNGEKVLVLYKKLWYAKIKYKGKVGYVRSKYIK